MRRGKMKRIFVLLGMAVLLSGAGCRSVEALAQLRSTPTNPPPTARPTFTRSPTPTSTLPLPTITLTRPRPTARPTAKPTAAPLPTQALATRSPYSFRVDSIRCLHSGGTFGNGFVLENQDHQSGINGIRVRMGVEPGGPGVVDYITENKYEMNEYFSEGGINGGFSFIINSDGASPGQVRYFWIVDSVGNPLSEPNKGRVVYSGSRDEHACWESIVVFIKN